MLNIENFEIYLHRQPVDFRKAINTLSILVQEEMRHNPFEKALFVFCNKRRNGIKILYWDNTGFALWYKRLEKDKFPWPFHVEEDEIRIESGRLRLLLDGYNIFKMKPHKKLKYETVL